MTKKLLLTAAALGAMAFAGAASAGSISAGQLSGVPITSGSGATLQVAPYTIANEATLAAAGTTSANDATSFLKTQLSSGVSLGGGASITLIVTYNLTGPATFATVAYDDLSAVSNAVVPPAVPAPEVVVAPTSGVATLSADKKSVQYIVSYDVTAGRTLDAFLLKNLDIKVTGKSDVSIASNVKLVVGATQTELDTTEATKIIQFKDALKGYAAVADTVVADLPDFLNFEDKTPGAGAPAGVAGNVATSDVLGLALNTGSFRKSLATADVAPLTVAAIVKEASVTVSGPQVEILGAEFAGLTAETAGATETSATFKVATANVGLLTSGALELTAPGDEVIEAGAYKAAVKLTPNTGFGALAETSVTLLNVALDGTNFVAPWFALDNGGANSTLRLANNGSAPVGPVTVTLKANNGAAAPTGVYTIPTIPAGSFVSVRGDQLKSAFGTTAANGDLLITIQSDTANVSAKVRTTQSTGQIYENSLGTGSQALVK